MPSGGHHSAVRHRSAVVSVILAVWGGADPAAMTCPGSIRVDETVRRVARLLPREPGCVVVVDPNSESPAMAERIRHFDAFTYPGNPTIFVRRHSPVYDLASQGAQFYQFVLAAVIWHEMAHVSGADEHEAQRQEEALWQQFIRDDRVGFAEGHAYLDLLRRRHGVQRTGP